MLLALVIVTLLVFSGDWGTTTTDNSVPTDDDVRNADLHIAAYQWAKEYVKDRLKCPSTATFPFFPEGWSQFKDQIYVLRSYVDSENSFGAMMRTHFIIKIQFIRNNATSQWDWTVLLFETTGFSCSRIIKDFA